MQAMVGFRNVAVHDYQSMSLPILRAILNGHLADFQTFSSTPPGAINATKEN